MTVLLGMNTALYMFVKQRYKNVILDSTTISLLNYESETTMLNYETVITELNNETVNNETVVDETVVEQQFRKLSPEEVEARKRNRVTKLKMTETDIATILKLRQAGITFVKIDEIVLGKTKSHGNYSFRVCQKYTLNS